MEKELNLKSDEALDYIKNNVENYDTLEISFNRIFVPGEVLDIDADEEESLKLLIQMNGELVNDTVQIDLVRIKDDILEIRHIKDDKSILIVVDA
jgi:hypothetical protein